uniref:hypothetical protein n=1 Tax=Klebsiella pneumoniae TaxID=573 RepID=UPI001F4B0229
FLSGPVGGGGLIDPRLRRGFFSVFVLLLTFSFRPYPLLLWITVLPVLCKSVPIAAAERPSVASQ